MTALKSKPQGIGGTANTKSSAPAPLDRLLNALETLAEKPDVPR